MNKAGLVLTLTAFAAGLGAGWLCRAAWGRERANPPLSVEGSGGMRDPLKNASPADAGKSGKNTPPPAWDPLLSADGNELATYAALEHVPAARIAEWLWRDYRLPANYSSSLVNLAWETTRGALLDRLLEKDPAAFAEWVSAMPADDLQSSWIESAARGLRLAGTSEEARTAAKLKAAHPEAWRDAELKILSESDPEAALARFPGNSRQWMPDACADLLASDPARALAYVGENPSAVTAVARAFRKLGPEALEIFAGKCPGDAEATRHLWRMVAVDKARRGDGKAFAAFLKEHPGLHDCPAGLLADANPVAAAETVTALAGEPIAQERVLAALAVSDPAQAARLLAASPDALAILELDTANIGRREPLLAGLAGSWLLLDAAAFQTWTHSLPAALRAKIIPKVANGLSGTEFLDFTRGTLPEGGMAGRQLGWQAVRNAPDTPGLLAWLDSFSPADQEKLVTDLCGPLAERDIAAATDLTVNLPDLQQREQSTIRVGHSARFTDVDQAMEWGASLPSDLRVKGLSAALQNMASNTNSWDAPLSEAVTDLIQAEPMETAAVWNELAATVTMQKSRENFPAGVAFWSGLPETAREAGLESLADSLLTKMSTADDPFPALRDLEGVPDAAARQKIAEIVQRYLPKFPQLSPTQTSAFTGQLEKLRR